MEGPRRRRCSRGCCPVDGDGARVVSFWPSYRTPAASSVSFTAKRLDRSRDGGVKRSDHDSSRPSADSARSDGFSHRECHVVRRPPDRESPPTRGPGRSVNAVCARSQRIIFQFENVQPGKRTPLRRGCWFERERRRYRSRVALINEIGGGERKDDLRRLGID